MKKIAAIGDIHGCLDELEQLLKHLEWVTLDEIWHLGDLVDRGPDSGGVVALCRERNLPGVLGNHEESILKHWKRLRAGGDAPMNDDKRRTLSQLRDEDVAYLDALPLLHKDPEVNAVLVHGGVWPSIPIDRQPKNVVRCQMVHFRKVGDTRWFGKDAHLHKSGCTEAENFDLGYRRWYELHDHPERVFFGHSVFSQPMMHQREGFGLTVGVDTGSCFGGALTAAIIEGDQEPWFVSVKARKSYFEKSFRVHQE